MNRASGYKMAPFTLESQHLSLVTARCHPRAGSVKQKDEFLVHPYDTRLLATSVHLPKQSCPIYLFERFFYWLVPWDSRTQLDLMIPVEYVLQASRS